MDISDETKNKIKSNKQEQKEDQQVPTSIKRRTLVKGSAAVIPTIFTLRSGGVLAQAQPSITCEVKDNLKAADGSVEPIIDETDPTDEFVRTDVSRLDLLVNDPDTGLPTTVGLRVFRRLEDTSGSWQAEDGGSTWTGDVVDVDGILNSDDGRSATITATGQSQILACPDSNELICTGENLTITNSCAVSLGLAATDPIL